MAASFGKDPGDVGAAPDLAVRPLDRVRAAQRRAAPARDGTGRSGRQASTSSSAPSVGAASFGRIRSATRRQWGAGGGRVDLALGDAGRRTVSVFDEPWTLSIGASSRRSPLSLVEARAASRASGVGSQRRGPPETDPAPA